MKKHQGILEGAEVIVRTDHKTLTAFFNGYVSPDGKKLGGQPRTLSDNLIRRWVHVVESVGISRVEYIPWTTQYDG